MALTLPWLLAAVVSAFGGTVWIPAAPLVDKVVARVVNDTAVTLAARRGVRLSRPIVVRLVGRAEMARATEAASIIETGGGGEGQGPQPATSPGRWPPPDADSPRQVLLAHLGLVQPQPQPTWPTGPSPASEVTGLYDSSHERLLLANWADLATGRFALGRDIAQALLDRRFDLERWLGMPAASRSSQLSPSVVSLDTFLARAALAYGDATTQALEQLDPEGTLPSSRALAVIAANVTDKLRASGEGQSLFVLQQRIFLELDGLRFVAGIRARSPWAAVDEVWRRPPQSTEQILHPDKYARAEKSDDVAARLPEQPHPSWRVAYRDTLGEWGVRLFLSLAGDDYRAERGAAGWDGDSALLVQSATEETGLVRDSDAGTSSPSPLAAPLAQPPTFVAWITTWDDDSDADDFAAEAARVLAQLAHVRLADARPASGRLRLVDGGGRLFALDRRRRAVGLVLAAPADAEGLLAVLMNAAAPSPVPSAPRRPERRLPDQARPRPR